MSKQIFIIRTAPYNYQIKGMNLYQSFDVVAKREKDVVIKSKADDFLGKNVPEEIRNIDSVYCSPRKRSIQTANLISTNRTVLNELMEIKFKMENFISEREFFVNKGKPNVKKARKAFVKALIKNELEESYIKVFKRVEALLQVISQDDANKILVFSHGFFMKVVESYIKDKRIKSNPKRLLKYFNGDLETFKFCEGFVLEFTGKGYKFHSYIRNKLEKRGETI